MTESVRDDPTVAATDPQHYKQAVGGKKGKRLSKPLLEKKRQTSVDDPSDDAPCRVPISLDRLDFHGDRRWALKNPVAAMQTLNPYGMLHVNVIAASGLRAMDTYFSDPFIEIYVNDELQTASKVIMKTLDPVWNFQAEPIGIWSPYSVVLLKVMDYDLASKSDLCGFVEFYIGDLEPNNEISGAFQIQGRLKLYGTATSRLRSPLHEDLPSTDDFVSKFQSFHSESSQQCVPLRRSSSSFLKRQFSRLSGKVPEDVEAGGELLSCTSANAKATSTQRNSQNSGDLLLSIKFEASSESGDEWFAFCFPRPQPKNYPKSSDLFPALQVGQVYEDVVAIKELLWDKVCRRIMLGLSYITHWRSKPLSLVILIWWWIVCIRPEVFLPTLPLSIAAFMYFVRHSAELEDMLIDETNAPLDFEGYKVVASFRANERMCRWISRIVEDTLESTIVDESEFENFAWFAWRDAKPTVTMDELLDALRKQTWIKPDKKKKKKSSPTWTHIPRVFLPGAVATLIRQWEDPLHHLRRELDHVLQKMDEIVERHINRFYAACVAFAVLLTLLCLLMSLASKYYGRLVQNAFGDISTVCWILLGTGILTLHTTWARRLRTHMRATADRKHFVQRRAAGGLSNWVAFTPMNTEQIRDFNQQKRRSRVEFDCHQSESLLFA